VRIWISNGWTTSGLSAGEVDGREQRERHHHQEPFRHTARAREQRNLLEPGDTQPAHAILPAERDLGRGELVYLEFQHRFDGEALHRHGLCESSGPQLNQHSSPAFITYLDVGYNITEKARLSIGANNLFDKRPDQQGASAIKFGSVPSAAPVYVWYSPYGNDGGYYYIRFKYSW